MSSFYISFLSAKTSVWVSCLFLFKCNMQNQQQVYWVLKLAGTPVFAAKTQCEVPATAKSKGDIVRYPSYPCQ